MAAADVIVANRAYLDHSVGPGEGEEPPAGKGGLVAAVAPVVQPWDGSTGTTWIGAGRGARDPAWVDADGYELIATERGPMRHRRLFFDDPVWEAHYGMVANSFLWPLLHLVRTPLPDLAPYFPRPLSPSDDDWQTYGAVNGAFADAAATSGRGEGAWIHDYQLGLAPAALRKRGYGGRIGFFLHTPFPSSTVAAEVLDARGRECFRQWVEGILGADLAGFQCPADVERFRDAVLRLGLGEDTGGALAVDGRTVRTGAFPVGIDFDGLVAVARSAQLPPVADEMADTGLPLIVGLERADYTKGIPERFAALAALARQGRRFAYLGVASPTREGVESYAALGTAIARGAEEAGQAVEVAGGRFRYIEQALSWPQVVSLLREADVVCTSSLADGMNLVPLQAVAAQSLRPADRRGVVTTGRDAGVASTYAGRERDGLVAIDPLDTASFAAALGKALEGKPGRISERLIGEVRARDARRWGDSFLEALKEKPC